MKAPILGWDVGGANIKAVRIERGDGEGPGRSPAVVRRPFPLWRDPDGLPGALAEIACILGEADIMAITMTAELADCFATKREGVVSVLDAFRAAFPGAALRVYGVDGRFRSVEAAREEPLRVAAANWMASATLVARWFPAGVFLDVGSTTTDIVPIAGGRVAAVGRTDTERLAAGELVYTGALRTPVSAIVRSVPFGGRPCRVAAEHFAVAADVHLWLGQIDERDYTSETPDGKGVSRPEAGARLARMVCADPETAGPEDIASIAGYVARAQVRQIAAGIRQVLGRPGSGTPSTALVAGTGAFLARAAARRAGLATRDLAERLGPAAAAAPAAAVAYLLRESAGG